MALFSPKTQGPGGTAQLQYDGQPVVPSDTFDLLVYANSPTAALYVTGAGNVAFQHRGGIAGSFTAVPAGTYLDVAATRVLATGTTATGIFQLAVPQYS